MQITLKLYAGLGDYLPPGTAEHKIQVTINPDTTAAAILQQFCIPPGMAHLVLLNGVYVNPEHRDTIRLHDGDTLAVWPPVAGGESSAYHP